MVENNRYLQENWLSLKNFKIFPTLPNIYKYLQNIPNSKIHSAIGRWRIVKWLTKKSEMVCEMALWNGWPKKVR